MQSGNLLVDILIATFSVIPPPIKLLTQAVLVFARGSMATLFTCYSNVIGKWNMAMYL